MEAGFNPGITLPQEVLFSISGAHTLPIGNFSGCRSPSTLDCGLLGPVGRVFILNASPFGVADNDCRDSVSVKLVTIPLVLEKQQAHFPSQGGRIPNVRGGKQSRTDGAEGTSLNGAKRKEDWEEAAIVRRRLVLDGVGEPPPQLKQTHLR